MASFVYTRAKLLLMQGGLNFQEAGHDIRLMLLMTNTTADTQEDATTISGFTTLDEYDTASSRKTLSNQATNEDTTNNRAEFDFDDVTWTALAAGARQIQAALLYRHVTNDSDSVPIAFIDGTGFPFTANGGNVVYTVNAEGGLQIT